jgi:helix-turn-helix, Psq domain
MSYVAFRLDSTVVHNAISTPDLDDNIRDVKDPPNILMAVRIDLAHQAWINAKGELTIGKACREFGVNPSTLHGRIHGAIPKALAS